MTAVESAAFGCPTVADGGGGVGALALLGGGGCVEVDLEGTIAGGEGGEKLALELAAIIADREGLRRVGEEGRRPFALLIRNPAVPMSLAVKEEEGVPWPEEEEGGWLEVPTVFSEY
ncbi:hypothetical protein THAOC_32583 [Thalassiosira oceanica]|uniref:Uncharacterized protein n=1 Tax=Thalassiosira oceanica TaxID=159749 RepID=K0RI85_THAOC|nr:hypothetical protein THAOC_32583 [Thalassiosira oceanica]|eukprot:EJK48606.1 hypothetical protein THAOC_32583 [Thalassiosira oceanica]